MYQQTRLKGNKIVYIYYVRWLLTPIGLNLMMMNGADARELVRISESANWWWPLLTVTSAPLKGCEVAGHYWLCVLIA